MGYIYIYLFIYIFYKSNILRSFFFFFFFFPMQGKRKILPFFFIFQTNILQVKRPRLVPSHRLWFKNPFGASFPRFSWEIGSSK